MSQLSTEERLKETINLLKSICERYRVLSVKKRLEEIEARLESPFMITVFGEVNSGKSSFLNALLGIPDLCKTDVDICTDRITVIRYSDKPYRRELDPLTEEVGVDNELLKGFTVVDTPGINSVLEHHTYITERFLPSSDVILVVIPATNPHTKPIWEWVGKIASEFGRKLVFVLQQKDLVSPEGLEKLMKKVKKYAEERGVKNPAIFAVSALWELKGEKERSGFKELRKFLNEHYTGERQLKVKLETVKFELERLLSECISLLQSRMEEAEALKLRVEETLKLLDEKMAAAESYRETLLQAIDGKVSKLADEVLAKLERISLIDTLFSRSKVKKLLEELRKELEEELKNFVEETLMSRLELFEKVILKSVLVEAAKRFEELNGFLEKVGGFDGKRVESQLLKVFESTTGGLKVGGEEKAIALMGGGLLAGGLMALLSGSFIVDITGGIISAVAVTLGSLYLLKKRRDFEREVRSIFEKELGGKLKEKLSKFLEKRLENTLGVIYKHLEERLKGLEKRIEEIERDRTLLVGKNAELRKLEI